MKFRVELAVFLGAEIEIKSLFVSPAHSSTLPIILYSFASLNSHHITAPPPQSVQSDLEQEHFPLGQLQKLFSTFNFGAENNFKEFD